MSVQMPDYDRHGDLYPDPAEPGPEQGWLPRYPQMLTQPGVADGLVPTPTAPPAGQPPPPEPSGVVGWLAKLLERRPDTGGPDEIEGTELRPDEGPFDAGGPGFLLRHEHHHSVDVVERAATGRICFRVVINASSGANTFGTYTATPVLPRDSLRRKVTVLNLSSSASTVTIGDQDVAAAITDGFDLVAGASLDIYDTRELYAIVPAGGSATLCLFGSRYGPDLGSNQE